MKFRNGLGEKDLAAVVVTALHRGATKRKTCKKCEDCGVRWQGGLVTHGRREGVDGG